jgi:formylglycine-generating enzyme required for sulfatase activity
MVLIAGGRFMMGLTQRPAEPNEGPQREVTLGPYWVDRTEVTVGAYRACVERGACVPPRISSRACTYDRGDPQLPMNCVSFDEADAYCLAQQKRLLTEAEWEYAARNGPGAPYPWGHETPGCDRMIAMRGDATTDGCGASGPQGVGLRPRGKSRQGVDDLAGNVEEWVSDFYDDRLPTEGASGAARGSSRVLRGGSWMSPRRATRVTARSWAGAQEHGPGVGLRCARDGGGKAGEDRRPVQ